MKKLLRRVPGLASAYRQAKILAGVAYERWGVNPERLFDRWHLIGEWNFQLPAEQERYFRVLTAVAKLRGPEGWGDVLEVGCSEGLFTLELARRAKSVTAIDISPVACARARQRCAPYAQVRIEHMDVVRTALPARYELAFAMDVLDYIHGRDRLRRAVANLLGSLVPGGVLAVCSTYLPEGTRHAWWARWFPEGADNILSFMETRFGLRPLYREEYPPAGRRLIGTCDHVIALFEKPRENGL